MVPVLNFIYGLMITLSAGSVVGTPNSFFADDDAVLQYQQFIREDAKEHRLFLENSFDKLLMLFSGGAFLFGSILTWLNYRTRTEIKTAVNKKFDEQIESLLGQKIEELQQNLESQGRELERRIASADKLIRELSGRLSQTDREYGNHYDMRYCQPIRRFLWVDDNPANNKNIVGMFPESDTVFDLVKSTDEAFVKLSKTHYTLIISDMNRNGIPDEGLRLLRFRNKNCGDIPFVIFSSSRSLAGYAQTAEKEGADLVTNKVTELLGYIQTRLE